jgi:hypothetical protein
MFISTFEKQLDAKRRIVVPQEFRAAVAGHDCNWRGRARLRAATPCGAVERRCDAGPPRAHAADV